MLPLPLLLVAVEEGCLRGLKVVGLMGVGGSGVGRAAVLVVELAGVVVAVGEALLSGWQKSHALHLQYSQSCARVR